MGGIVWYTFFMKDPVFHYFIHIWIVPGTCPVLAWYLPGTLACNFTGPSPAVDDLTACWILSRQGGAWPHESRDCYRHLTPTLKVNHVNKDRNEFKLLSISRLIGILVQAFTWTLLTLIFFFFSFFFFLCALLFDNAQEDDFFYGPSYFDQTRRNM